MLVQIREDTHKKVSYSVVEVRVTPPPPLEQNGSKKIIAWKWSKIIENVEFVLPNLNLRVNRFQPDLNTMSKYFLVFHDFF